MIFFCFFNREYEDMFANFERLKYKYVHQVKTFFSICILEICISCLSIYLSNWISCILYDKFAYFWYLSRCMYIKHIIVIYHYIQFLKLDIKISKCLNILSPFILSTLYLPIFLQILYIYLLFYLPIHISFLLSICESY